MLLIDACHGPALGAELQKNQARSGRMIASWTTGRGKSSSPTAGTASRSSAPSSGNSATRTNQTSAPGQRHAPSRSSTPRATAASRCKGPCSARSSADNPKAACDTLKKIRQHPRTLRHRHVVYR
jgi:hypothetical protein